MMKYLTFKLFLISVISVQAGDIKFVQVDSVKFSPNTEEITDNFKKLVTEINKEKRLPGNRQALPKQIIFDRAKIQRGR